LDFAYLVDLSKTDMHLRHLVLRLTLDIEHALKTKLLADFNATPESEDGYDILTSFFETYESRQIQYRIKKEIDNLKNGKHSPSSYIIERYAESLAIWNFVEIIQFGELINFCNYFYKKYPNKLYSKVESAMHNIKFLRNASAHNNCILLLKDKNAKPQEDTYQYIFKLLLENKVDIQNIKNFLRNHTINDFIASMVVFDKICLNYGMKRSFFSNLRDFFTGRMIKNKEYYADNKLLTDSYKFVFEVVKLFYKKYHPDITNI
jgi:hypothetical protein